LNESVNYKHNFNSLKLLSLTIFTFTLLTYSGIAVPTYYINVTTNVSWGTQYSVNYSVNVSTYIQGNESLTMRAFNYTSVGGPGARIFLIAAQSSLSCVNRGYGNDTAPYHVDCTNASLITNRTLVWVKLYISKNDTNGNFMVYSLDNNSQNQNMSSNNSISFSIDPYPPAITPYSPQNNYTYTNFYVNATIMDPGATLSNVKNNSVYYRLINASGNYTPWTVLNNITTEYMYSGARTFNFSSFFNVTSAPDGAYNISFNASDNAGNTNVTTQGLFIILDKTPPNIELITPAQGANSSVVPPLVFMVTDNFAEILNCSLNVNGTISWLDEPVLNDSLMMIENVTSTQGTHYWNLTCYDLANSSLGSSNGNSNTSLTQSFTFDQNGPTFLLSSANTTYPAGQTYAGLGQNITINVSVTDAISGVATIYVYGYDNTTGEQVCVQGTVSLINTSGTWLGNCTINGSSRENVSQFNMTAIDYAGNDNSMEPGVEVKVDVTEPGLSNVSSNSTTDVSRSDVFLIINATVSDSVSGIKTVNISKSGSTTKNMTLVNEFMWSYTGTLANLGCTSDGSCVLITQVTDNAGNVFTDSLGFNMTVDNTNATLNFTSIRAGELVATGGCGLGGPCLRNISFTVFDAGGIDGVGINLVSLAGDTYPGNFSQNLSCDFNIVSVCTIEWNYTGAPSSILNLTIGAIDLAGNPNSTMINFTIDADNPQMSLVNISNLTSDNSTLAGRLLRINISVSDSFTGVNASFVNISYMITNQSWLIDTGAGNGSKVASFIPNYTGPYAVLVWANDSAGNWNGNLTVPAFNVYNGAPIIQSNDTTKLTIQNITFTQNKPRYDAPVPIYGGQDNLTLVSGSWISPVYFDNISQIVSSVMETVSFNYSFKLNMSNASNNSLVKFSILPVGLIPVNVSNMTIFTPAGNKTIIMMMPASGMQIEGHSAAFTIFLNGQAFDQFGMINTSHPINGTYLPQQNVTIVVNVTDNTTLANVTILFSAMPPINVTQQTLYGFAPGNPPTMGEERLNTSYEVNLTSVAQFYMPENMTITFMFPRNITITNSTGDSTTYVLSSEVILNRWNGTSWSMVGNSSNTSGINLNRAFVINTPFQTNDSMVGSPTYGSNITITMWGFRYRLDENRTLGWTAGASIALQARTVLNFSFINMTTGNGTIGTNVSANFTVNMGIDGGLIIPSSYLPGFDANSANVVLLLNGQPLTENTHFARGSIIINGKILNQGANVVSVTYTAAAAPPSTPISGGGGGGGAGGGASSGSQSVIIATVTQGIPAIASFTDTLLYITKVNVTSSKSASNVKITVTNLNMSPIGIASPEGTLFKYADITTQNILSSDMEKVKIKFRVNISWYTANNLDPPTTKLNRYSNGVWSALRTVQVSSNDTTYYYFEADSPGLSTFAITASPKGTAPAPTVCSNTCPTGQSQRAYPDCSCYTPSQPSQPSGTGSGEQVTTAQSNYDWLVFVVVIIAITAMLVFMMRKRIRLTAKHHR